MPAQPDRQARPGGPGEVGDVVVYCCVGEHNTGPTGCEPGEPHAAIVGEVLNRDADGRPALVRLAVMLPGVPSLHWVTAQRATRTPDAGATVTRVHRGAPPAETCTDAHLQPGAPLIFTLDTPLNTWLLRGE